MDQNQRRLKIAIIADTVNASAGAGGPVSGQQLVDRLRNNHDVTIVSADEHSTVKLRSFRPLFLAAIRHVQFVFAIPNRKALRAAFADTDIVHLYFPFWLSFVALDEARKAGKPVVASFHVQPENMLHNLHIRWPWLNRKIYQFWVKRLWNHVDLVMCPSEFAANILKSHQLQTPTVAISNGITFESATTEYEREPAHQGYFLIFMLGRLAAEKEQAVLIEAVRRSPHRDRIKIVIAGMGQFKNKLIKLAKTLPNGADIGFISNERKKHLLATADLFVHCSSIELEGMAVLEAMGAGLPALVAEGSETAASTLALPDFRFPVGDVDALTAKLDWLIENPAALAESKNRYLAAAQKLNITNSIKDVEDRYHALCN